MKLISTLAITALLPAAAMADDAQLVLDRVSTGGLVAPVIETAPVIVEEQTSRLGLIAGGLAGLALIGLAISEDDDETTTTTVAAAENHDNEED